MALLNDVLDISKIEAGKLEIARIDGDLALTVDRVRQLFQAARRGARSCRCAGSRRTSLPKRLRYDPVRVRQCVANLLSNAIKFTEHGRHHRSASAPMQQAEGEWTVRISVSDTGIGMDEATLSRLFGAFTQADASIIAALRRHRPRPCDHAPARAPDGRRCLGRKPAGRRLDLPLHLPRRSQRRRGRCSGGERPASQPRRGNTAQAAHRRARAAGRRQRRQPPGGQAVHGPAGAAIRRGDQRRGGAGAPARAGFRHRPAGRPHAGDGRQGSDQAHPRQRPALARHSGDRADRRRDERRSRTLSRHGHETTTSRSRSTRASSPPSMSTCCRAGGC